MSADLDAFFRPSSIAVVGVSRDATSYSRRLLGFLRQFGYPGFVVGVNPSLEEADGVRCVPTLHDVGQPVDLVLVFTPAARVVDVMSDAANTGARAAIVYSSGFAEVGADGRVLQDAVRDIAAGAGMRVLGPNCQGVIHLPARTVASFSNAAAALDVHRVARVAYVGQSGAVGGAMFDLLRERGLTPAVWVSTGNQVDVDVTEVAGYLVHDAAVDTILVYVEQTPDGATWDALGRAASEAGKQIVALHPGSTAASRRAMLSHTGALVGARRPFELTSRSNGIVLVDDLEPMIDVALARHGGAHRAGRRLAIITTSGGAGGLAADWCPRCGLQVPALAPATRDVVDELLPDFASSVNPIDVTGMFVRPGASRMGELCAVVARDPAVDHVLLVLTNTVGEAARQLARSIADARALLDAPLSVVYLAAADRTVDVCEIMVDGGLPVFRGVAAALRAIGTVALRAEPAPDDAPPESARFTVMSEADGHALLEEIGVAGPASILVHSAIEAKEAALALGGRVVLKVQSPDVLHKSDVGAVALGVQPDDAQAAYDALVSRVRQFVPTAEIEGVLVQEQVDAGVELLVGLQAASGGYAPVLTVGVGGTAVEIYGDIANALAPVAPDQALGLLRTLRGWPLLDGFRGGARVDVEAAARAISAISRLGDRFGDALVDLEVNPLIVHTRGVHAVDFVCRLRNGSAVSAQHIVVDAGDIKLSGLLAEPARMPPIAVVVAIPGSGMLGRYFDGPVDPAASLLALGAAQGFTVWAIDRPGYGASADVPEQRIDILSQAGVVHLAIDTFARTHDIGAGFFVVGHSYGFKLALVMAADTGRPQLLGVGGAGTGLRYAIDARRPPPRVPGDRGPMWGPEHLYPPRTFASGSLPLARVPAIQASEAAAWPALLRSIADDISVPLQFTYGDHERLWPIDDASLSELRAVFTSSPRVEIAIQPGAGHNVSLSNAAADYHARALAFALTCSDGSSR